MLISRIKAKNFKTYLDLDLDLTVKPDRPIVLVGGMNGGGKTTMFEAIYGALYGLNIKDKHHFMELVNNGASGRIEPKIELEITFTEDCDFFDGHFPQIHLVPAVAQIDLARRVK